MPRHRQRSFLGDWTFNRSWRWFGRTSHRNLSRSLNRNLNGRRLYRHFTRLRTSQNEHSHSTRNHEQHRKRTNRNRPLRRTDARQKRGASIKSFRNFMNQIPDLRRIFERLDHRSRSSRNRCRCRRHRHRRRRNGCRNRSKRRRFFETARCFCKRTRCRPQTRRRS